MTQEPLLLSYSEADIAAERAEAASLRRGDSLDPHLQVRNVLVVALVGAYVRALVRRKAL
jgi:hypothetical protein